MSVRCRPISPALVALIVFATSCTSYKQIGLDEVTDQDKVRVTTLDEIREIIADPRVEADSIIGEDSTAISLDQVAKVEAKKKDLTSTLLLVGVGVALVTVIAVRVAECASNSYGSSC